MLVIVLNDELPTTKTCINDESTYFKEITNNISNLGQESRLLSCK